MIEQLRVDLASFQPQLGFNPLEVEQGTYNWERMRLGVITASRISELLTPNRLAPLPDDFAFEKVGKDRFVVTAGEFKGLEWQGTRQDEFKQFIREKLPMKPSLQREGYMNHLIAEIATKMPQEPVSAKTLEYGKENEPKARDAFAFMNGITVHEIPFIYADKSMRCGASPDGIFGDTGCEIKCPFTSKVHVATLLGDKINDEYILQMQFQMFVTGAKEWTFVSYDPRMPGHLSLKTVTVPRCEVTQELIKNSVTEFIEQMDARLAQLGLKFGDQWLDDAQPEQIEQQAYYCELEQDQQFNVDDF